MTYEEVNPSTWTYEKEGDFIEGVFIATQHDVGVNKSNLYNLETQDRGILSVWGSAILDQRMALVKPGDKIKITYQGLGEAKSGKNAPKIFKVEVDK